MSVINFSSGLRLKSILLTTISALIIVVFFLFYALPTQKQHIISTFAQVAKNQLKTLSTITISPLLKGQYAAVYEIFHNQIKDNPHWKKLKLINHTGQVLYPLTPWNSTIEENEILVIEDIYFLDEDLGQIILIANYTKEVNLLKICNLKLYAYF